jgi:hypothetical protein
MTRQPFRVCFTHFPISTTSAKAMFGFCFAAAKNKALAVKWFDMSGS